MVPSVPPVAYMPFILGSLPFIIFIVIIVMFFRYLLNKKRLEHQQIMAAIEKGIPLSELRSIEKKGPNWIRSLSVGIMFLLMGIGLPIVIFSVKPVSGTPFTEDPGLGLFIAVIFLAIGIAKIIRGILQRKADKEQSALDANHGQ